jgi:hypothetical protein
VKAKLYDVIITLIDVKGDFSGLLFPKGTRGTIVECYHDPLEGYAVDLAIPDETQVSGFRYDNVILYPEQFVVDEEYHGDESVNR